MRVTLLSIGDELLIGQVINTNAAWMAEQLNQNGAVVFEVITVADDLPQIQEGLQRGLTTSDIVLMTGGLGPTKDDVTKKALADFFNVGFVFSQETHERISKLFQRWGREMTEAHRNQCFMPQNAELLYNKMGTAPGMWFEAEGKVIVSMPGVPYEMQYLMEHAVMPRLLERFPVDNILHRTILTVGEGESRIAQRIETIEDNLPAGMKLAYLPNLGRVRLRLTAKGTDAVLLAQQLDEQEEAIRATIPELIFGAEKETLEEKIGELLRENKKTIATAESCTGGYLAHRLTITPGASDYFVGSVIAYSNQVKMEQLGVQEATLNTHGAVSEQTVMEMVAGALKSLKSDIAIAVSGIAGPGGGSPAKPVGTIWLAIGDAERTVTYLLKAGKDRERNIEYTTVYALNLIRQFLLRHL